MSSNGSRRPSSKLPRLLKLDMSDCPKTLAPLLHLAYPWDGDLVEAEHGFFERARDEAELAAAQVVASE